MNSLMSMRIMAARVEQELGQRLAQLGLAHAGRPEEEERADRPVRVLQARARAADGVGHGRTASSWPTTRWCSASSITSSFSRSPSHHPRHGDAGPRARRPRRSPRRRPPVRSSVVLLRPSSAASSACLQLRLELRQLAVLQLGQPLPVALAARPASICELRSCSISSLMCWRALRRCAFSPSHCSVEVGVLRARARAISSSIAARRFFARLVLLLLHGLALDLQLHQPALDLVDRSGFESISISIARGRPRRSGRSPCPAGSGR